MDSTHCLAVNMPFLFSVERRPSSFVINLFNAVISENSKLLSLMIVFTKLYYYLKTSTAKGIGKLFHLVHSLQSYTCR